LLLNKKYAMIDSKRHRLVKGDETVKWFLRRIWYHLVHIVSKLHKTCCYDTHIYCVSGKMPLHLRL